MEKPKELIIEPKGELRFVGKCVNPLGKKLQLRHKAKVWGMGADTFVVAFRDVCQIAIRKATSAATLTTSHRALNK